MPLEKNQRIAEEGIDRSKQTREFRERLEKFNTRNKPLKGSREFENKKQSSRRNEIISKKRSVQYKELTARKELENFR